MTRLGSAISLGTLINLIILTISWFSGAARGAQHWLVQREGHEFPIRLWAILPPAFIVTGAVLGTVQWFCTLRAARRFGRTIEHLTIAFVGGSFILICQTLMPKFWLVPVIVMLFVAAMVNQILFERQATLVSIIWLALGLIVTDFLLSISSAAARGTPIYLVWLAMIVTIWSAIFPRRDMRLSWWMCGLEPRMNTDQHR